MPSGLIHIYTFIVFAVFLFIGMVLIDLDHLLVFRKNPKCLFLGLQSVSNDSKYHKQCVDGKVLERGVFHNKWLLMALWAITIGVTIHFLLDRYPLT